MGVLGRAVAYMLLCMTACHAAAQTSTVTPAGITATQSVSPSGAKAPILAPYTLHTSARSVLADVVVVDGKGAPVHDLPKEAFHLFDEGKPQELTSFEERHTDVKRPELLHTAPGVYTTIPRDYRRYSM